MIIMQPPAFMHRCKDGNAALSFGRATVTIAPIVVVSGSPATLLNVQSCHRCGARFELKIRSGVLGWREIGGKVTRRTSGRNPASGEEMIR